MARLKIDYGIDLGTTNSSICRMENGEPTIKKSDTLKDTMPSCVSFTKKQSNKIGDSAFNDLKSDRRRATKTWKTSASNTFIEFKRTMGLETKYNSSNMGKEFSSDELSAEVLKTLKSFIIDEKIKSAVITVPAKFAINQKDATMRAAKLAGLEHCELLQEPIAAAMAYGLSCDQKNAFWMVFDFGGGTFDVALLKIEDGIIQVFDTEGDNYLGGQDLDYAIVDEIIIPYLIQNFTIDNILNDDQKRKVLRDAMKTYAENAKNQLSFKESEDIISNLEDLGEDDNGTELELDITITQPQLKNVFNPIFQKTIAICKNILERNNMKGKELDSLILVGGPTYSPILRQMLREEITPNIDTSVDPMTVVARGAALYASTIENNIQEELEPETIALDILHESTSVETMEFVVVKLLPNKCTGNIPSQLFVEIVRSDKAWSSGRVKINSIGDIIECQLVENKANRFIITTIDQEGIAIPCFPNEITIIQGSKIGSAILPYNIGIEIWNDNTKKAVFKSILGLERNQMMPAVGVINNLKTSCDLLPGIATDYIKIPIYQGDDGADGLKATCFEHVYDAVITGECVPSLLQSGSDVDITIKVDRSEGMTMEVFFPSLDHTEEIKFNKNYVQKEISKEYLNNEISKTENDLQILEDAGEDISSLKFNLSLVQKGHQHGSLKKQTLQHLKEIQRKIDKLDLEGEWSRLEKELRIKLEELEQVNKEYGNNNSTQQIIFLKHRVEMAILNKDIAIGRSTLNEIEMLFYSLTKIYQLINFVNYYINDFDLFSWKDPSRARYLLNQCVEIINDDPTDENLHILAVEIQSLLPNEELPPGAEGLLQQ